jgi:hypothetical protein
LYQLPIWVWPTALLSVCAIAVWRGRDEERLAAAAELATWALTLLVFRSRSESTQWSVLVIDSLLFVLFLWLALRSRRYWPLFAAGFQLLAVVTHIGRTLDTSVSGWAYLTAVLIWNYLTLFTIGYGAWTASANAHDVGRTGSRGPPVR